LKKNDFVVRFAGEGGQGFLSAAQGFASANTTAGYHSQTFATFPSQIMGGPTWMQARIATYPIHTRGDELDVLVVFNEEAFQNHKGELHENGVVLYDSEKLEVSENIRKLGLPFEKIGKSTGNARAANMVMLGALATLVNLPIDIFEGFVRRRWGDASRYGEAIVLANIKALQLGKEEALKSSFSVGELELPSKPQYDQILLNGNEAISLGAVHAGLSFFVGYPISPATSILIWMQKYLIGKGKFVYQASSEIESITALLGAGYSGVKAMTSTAGPGFSLMSEGLGMGWIAEIPLVVVDVQRGGPATGLPTKTEQSDFLGALNPAHGDVMLPVIAPGTVEECFYATIAAFNWAERYQGPVVLLSEHSLSERQQNISRPDLSKIKIENRDIYRGDDEYQRYQSNEVSPMPIPGSSGSYVANASEHDGVGDTTHLPHRHVEMTNRRFGKLSLLVDGSYESENVDSNIVILPWGGTKGPAREAYDRLIKEGYSIGWAYTMFLHPLPPDLLSILKDKDLVLVPELNYIGQFSSYLRGLGINAYSITQYTGLPFKVVDLVEMIKEKLES
jgi:2-oxoglutarate ferredoxin oxidoreductase subunit alpha